jgi:LemA protein
MSAVTQILRAMVGGASAPPARIAPRPVPGARPRRRLTLRARLVQLYRERPRQVWLGAGIVLLLVLLGATIRYYNLLVCDHADALAARAKVQALVQRRADLARALEQTVLAHAKHETAVFRNVTEQRVALAGPPPPSAPAPAAAALVPPAAALTGLPDFAGLPLSKLLAIAEQYPQVRLGENLQAVIGALVDVEKDLAKVRQAHVDATNRYTHHLDTFPGNFFGRVFGFRDIPFFEADPAAQRFAPVTYR